MTLKEHYEAKLCTMDDVLASIHDNDIICGGGELTEPVLF